MGDEQHPEWRHLLPIPGLDEASAQTSAPLRVVVEIDEAWAGRPVVQHLSWLLVTLIVRSTAEVVEHLYLDCPDIALQPGVDPAEPNGGPSLSTALRRTADTFGPSATPITTDADVAADIVLRIGSGERDADPEIRLLYVSASGWTGAVSQSTLEVLKPDPADRCPIGAYVAACLAAGKVFLLGRTRDEPLQTLALDAWTLQRGPGADDSSSVDVGTPEVELDHVLAGTGAVGSALLLTLWSYESVSGTVRAADTDEKGVDLTNLNRCVPFGYNDLGKPKAAVAAARLSGRHGFVIEPTFGPAEGLVGSQSHLISAVDTPKARQGLQDKYPRSVVQASTEGLRLECLRVDPTAGTACLRCFNPPQPATSDADIRARVARMDDDELAVQAQAVGGQSDEIRDWARIGGCGRIGDALLDRLRPSGGTEAQFSVGFVSVLAGVLLAAQVIKDSVRRHGDPAGITVGVPLDGQVARYVLNLYAPSGLAGARPYLRDSSCPSCDGIRAEIWAKRWTG